MRNFLLKHLDPLCFTWLFAKFYDVEPDPWEDRTHVDEVWSSMLELCTIEHDIEAVVLPVLRSMSLTHAVRTSSKLACKNILWNVLHFGSSHLDHRSFPLSSASYLSELDTVTVACVLFIHSKKYLSESLPGFWWFFMCHVKLVLVFCSWPPILFIFRCFLSFRVLSQARLISVSSLSTLRYQRLSSKIRNMNGLCQRRKKHIDFTANLRT